jgi:hypothetical protein
LFTLRTRHEPRGEGVNHAPLNSLTLIATTASYLVGAVLPIIPQYNSRSQRVVKARSKKLLQNLRSSATILSFPKEGVCKRLQNIRHSIMLANEEQCLTALLWLYVNDILLVANLLMPILNDQPQTKQLQAKKKQR